MSLQEQLESEIEELENVQQEQSGSDAEGEEGQSGGQEHGFGFRSTTSGDEEPDDGEQLAEDGQDVERQQERGAVLSPEDRIAQLEKALNSERAQRRIANKDAEKLRDLEQRLWDMQSRIAPQDQTQDPDAKPDRNKDPLAYLDWLDKQVDTYREQEQQRAQMQMQQQQHQQFVRQVEQYGGQAENEFRAVKPDYDDAFKHYAETRIKAIKAFGADEQTAAQALQNELLQLTASHAQVGSNPAEAIYNAAAAMGYQPGGNKQAQTQQRQAQRGTNTPTLPAGGTPPKQNAISLDSMMKASPEDFDKMWAEAERNGLLG